MATVGVEALEDLAGEFTRGAEHQYPAAFRLRFDAVLQQAMQDREGERRGLSGTGLGNADDIASGEGKGNGLSLDGRGRQIILFGERTGDGIGKAEILKGGQKGVSFIKSRKRPGGIAGTRDGCLETPACRGRRWRLAEGASQKPLGGSEHAARDDLMILKVLWLIWSTNAAVSRWNCKKAAGCSCTAYPGLRILRIG